MLVVAQTLLSKRGDPGYGLRRKFRVVLVPYRLLRLPYPLEHYMFYLLKDRVTLPALPPVLCVRLVVLEMAVTNPATLLEEVRKLRTEVVVWAPRLWLKQQVR